MMLKEKPHQNLKVALKNNKSNQKTNKNRGFTLIELMVVIAIIGIMASLTLPEYSNWVQQAKIKNAVKLTSSLKVYINKYYQKNAHFPANNISAGIPIAEKLLSPEVSAIHLINGAFHISLSKDTHKKLAGKTISVRPVYVADSPKSPISWICGNAKVPEGMSVAGQDKTNIPYTFLPLECRDLTGTTAQKQTEHAQKNQQKLPSQHHETLEKEKLGTTNNTNQATNKNAENAIASPTKTIKNEGMQ